VADPSIFLASGVRLAGPVALGGLGETVSERAGVFNVGLEGLMLAGCFGAVAGANAAGNAWVGVLAGAATGMLLGLLLGCIVAGLRADQIVTGIGLNLAVLGTTSFLRDRTLGAQVDPVSPGALESVRIPVLADIPVVGSALFDQSPLIYAAAVLAVVLWAFLRFTRGGLVVRATGDRAAAADASGVPVVLVRVLSVAFAGAMAGLAGAYLALVQAGGIFIDNMTQGRGYLAIAVAIFGRWRPLWVCAAALLFGGAEALQYEGQSIGVELPTAVLLMFPFVLALVTWVALGRSSAAPGDLGRPFVRGRG
jgi:simple sugar transport system permease protein